MTGDECVFELFMHVSVKCDIDMSVCLRMCVFYYRVCASVFVACVEFLLICFHMCV